MNEPVPAHPLANLTASRTPTASRAVYYPAVVRAPGIDRAVYMAKVVMSDGGVHVYVQGRTLQGAKEIQEVFSADIDYDKTPRPRSDYAARRAGWGFPTSAGELVVTAGGGCGSCGYAAIRDFLPEWAGRTVEWKEA